MNIFNMSTTEMPTVSHKFYDNNGNIISKNKNSRLRGKLRGVGYDGSIINVQNSTAYNGRRYILESIFKQSPISSQKLTLNSILGINADTDSRSVASEYNARKICLAGVGTGGASTTFGDVYDASVNDNNLFNIIPLRCVPTTSDLTTEEQAEYALKLTKTINSINYYLYYLKIVTPNAISVQLQSTNYTPSTSDNTPTKDSSNPLYSTNIDVYDIIPISISESDIKEYFKVNDGNITNARFNEIALFEGYYDSILKDYIHVEAFSHLTMNNRPMDTDGAKYDYNYYLIN